MAAKNKRSQRKHLKSGSSYSSEELRFMTMKDGTRVVHSADGDIKRPVCAGIDVHKEILMAAVCETDPETLKAIFYVRKFTTMNSDIRSMALWLREHSVEDVCMESTGKYWIPVIGLPMSIVTGLVGGMVGYTVGSKVGDAIYNGARKVAKTAKEIGKNVWNGIKNTGKSIVRGIGRGIGRLLGFA